MSPIQSQVRTSDESTKLRERGTKRFDARAKVACGGFRGPTTVGMGPLQQNREENATEREKPLKRSMPTDNKSGGGVRPHSRRRTESLAALSMALKEEQQSHYTSIGDQS